MADASNCKKFLEAEMRGISETMRNNPESVTAIDFLNRNILIYSWLVQRRMVAVEKKRLFKLVGPSVKNEVEDRLRSHDSLADYVAINTSEAFALTQEAMTCIEEVLSDPKHLYNITQQVPFFDGGTTGIELIEYMTGLEEPEGLRLEGLIRNAFAAALPTVGIHLIHDKYPTVRRVSGPNGWHFLLAMKSHDGVLDRTSALELVNDVSYFYNWMEKNGYGSVEVLLLAPALDNVERDIEIIHRYGYIHHMWTLSIVRFFHLLEECIRGRAPRAAEVFPTIFVETHPIAYQVDAGIAALRAALDKTGAG